MQGSNLSFGKVCLSSFFTRLVEVKTMKPKLFVVQIQRSSRLLLVCRSFSPENPIKGHGGGGGAHPKQKHG